MCGHYLSRELDGRREWPGVVAEEAHPPGGANTVRERLVIHCQTTSVSAAHATHFATYGTLCRLLK